MVKLSKRARTIRAKITLQKKHSIEEALSLFSNLPPVKFPESLELAIPLNIDPKKTDQTVRGTVTLPHGAGRKTRVIVFAQEASQIAACEAQGAIRVGFEDLANEIKNNEFDLSKIDVVIATPDAMRLLMPLASILGPKKIMPNVKLGTVTADPASAVREAMLGRVQYRNDKGGVIHCWIGKINFTEIQVKENIKTLIDSILKNKPATASKGKSFLKKVVLSSTMGPGLIIDHGSLDISIAV
jgi:large subunit ribosomal protein L1